MRISRKSAFLAAGMYLLIAVSVSCVRQSETDEQYGFIGLRLEVDAHVEEVTKAHDLQESDYSEYNVSLYKDGMQLWKTTYDEFVSDVSYNRVEAGNYYLEIESCTEEEAEVGNGILRYCGGAPVTVVAGRTSDAPVLCKMANARVTLALDPSFAAEIVDSKAGASVTDGRRKISLETVDVQHLPERSVYFNVGEDNTLTVTFTVTMGIVATQELKSFELSVDLEGGQWNKITLVKKQ